MQADDIEAFERLVKRQEVAAATMQKAATVIAAAGTPSSWFDAKGLVLFALGALLTFGGAWTAMSVAVAEVRGEVRQAKNDVDRVERRHDALEGRFNAHVQGPHNSATLPDASAAP